VTDQLSYFKYERWCRLEQGTPHLFLSMYMKFEIVLVLIPKLACSRSVSQRSIRQ
jgi:hypothetical protein